MRLIGLVLAANLTLVPLAAEAQQTALICSPIELDTDGAILLRQDGRASWASFHGGRVDLLGCGGPIC